MNKAEAREIVKHKKGELVDRVMAASELIYASDCSFQDLLLCVEHGGLPAEWAAIQLYRSTQRPRRDDSLDSFIMDASDWESYLKQQGLL